MIKQIDLAGDHYTMGWQHGRQVQDLRPRILAAVENRLEILQGVDLDLQPILVELSANWEQSASTTMAMMRGIPHLPRRTFSGLSVHIPAIEVLHLGQVPSAVR